MDENKKIDAYMQQMMKIKAQKEQEQTETDMNEIARELGFDDADLQLIEQERVKLVSLGKGFVEHQQADDAIEVLEKAYNLKPKDEETLQHLAQAYGIKYVRTNNHAFKQKSEDFASMCVQINPNNQVAFQILQSVRYKPKKQVRVANVVIAGVIVLVLGFVFYSFLAPSKTVVVDNTSSGTQEVEVVKSEGGNTVTSTNTPLSNNAITFTGEKQIAVDINGENVKLQYGNEYLVTKFKGVKRKYYNGSGTQIVEVKMYPGEDRFKVRTNDGKELWKVNWYPQKIKIKNEEKGLEYEVKAKDSGKMKVTKNDAEIGESKLNETGDKIKIEANGTKIYEHTSTQNKYSYGVLAIKDIPEAERMVILAELSLRGL